MSGCPSQCESRPLHPLLLPAWFASITTAPLLPRTCVPLSSLHVYSCQEFGLEMTSPASQTFLFCTLKSLWNLARLPKLSLSSLVTLLNIKHFYCIKPCWKEKGKTGKGKKANPCTQCEGRGWNCTGMDQVFVLLCYYPPCTCCLLTLNSSLGISHSEKPNLTHHWRSCFQADPESLGNGKTHPTIDPASLPKEKTVF